MIGVVFLQLGQAIPSSPMELITSSTGATKIVLAILVVLSLLSWGIIFAKNTGANQNGELVLSFIGSGFVERRPGAA